MVVPQIKVILMDLTKYERARIIGARALQLYFGAPPLVATAEGESDYIKLAETELEEGIIPLVVVRENSPE
ncbi:MAG: DNA-directed RNA polymerase subunit K [Candidatus ainarchaeum sp.]|nr:DNA-directed RNA polymerase subunit K [Candidatus ainarchaeum sp.]